MAFKGASAGYSKLVDKRIFESSQENNYIISANYPEFQPAASESLNESLNKYIYDDIIFENISAFKDEIAGYDKEQNGRDGESLAWQYGLTIEYEVITYTDKVVSLLFTEKRNRDRNGWFTYSSSANKAAQKTL